MTKLSERIASEIKEWNMQSRQYKTWDLLEQTDQMDEDMRLQLIAGEYLYRFLSPYLPCQAQESEIKNAIEFKPLANLLSWLSDNPAFVEQLIHGTTYERLSYEIRRRIAMKKKDKKATANVKRTQ